MGHYDKFEEEKTHDAVNHPTHYNVHPSGIECIQITEHMNFCLGSAIKYLWRAGLKSGNTAQDLEKAVWYINRELNRLDDKELVKVVSERLSQEKPDNDIASWVEFVNQIDVTERDDNELTTWEEYKKEIWPTLSIPGGGDGK